MGQAGFTPAVTYLFCKHPWSRKLDQASQSLPTDSLLAREKCWALWKDKEEVYSSRQGLDGLACWGALGHSGDGTGPEQGALAFPLHCRRGPQHCGFNSHLAASCKKTQVAGSSLGQA